MRLKRHQIITLIIFGALTLTILMAVISGALVSAAANSSAFPYRIGFKDFAATPTPFQPNAFANILETLPPDPPAEMMAVAEPLPAQGEALLVDAEAAYGAAGFSADQFATTRDELKPKVLEQLTGEDPSPSARTWADSATAVP